jgi:hypothetical protein
MWFAVWDGELRCSYVRVVMKTWRTWKVYQWEKEGKGDLKNQGQADLAVHRLERNMGSHDTRETVTRSSMM